MQEGVHRGGDRGAHDSGSCSKSLIKICLLPRQSSSSSMILPAIFFLCLQRRVYWESEGGKAEEREEEKKEMPLVHVFAERRGRPSTG